MPDEEFRDVSNELARMGAKKMHRWPEWQSKFLTMMRESFGADDEELYGPAADQYSESEWTAADMAGERPPAGSGGAQKAAASNAMTPAGWKKKTGFAAGRAADGM